MNTVNGQVTDGAAVVLTDAMRGYHHEDDTVEPDAVKYAELLRDSGLLRQDAPRPVDGEHAVCNACGWDGSPTRITCPDCGSADVNYFTPGSAAPPPTASPERVAEVLASWFADEDGDGKHFGTTAQLPAEYRAIADEATAALLSAGVFTEARPEAEVKAEALCDAALAFAGRREYDDTVTKRSVKSWLYDHAAVLRAGGQS